MALLATLLAALGIHAVLANHAARRHRDIGVRLALGAKRGHVVGGVLRSGLVYWVAGVVVGLLGAALSVGLLESLLFGVDALAPGAFVLPAAGVTGVADPAGGGAARGVATLPDVG